MEQNFNVNDAQVYMEKTFNLAYIRTGTTLVNNVLEYAAKQKPGQCEAILRELLDGIGMEEDDFKTILHKEDSDDGVKMEHIAKHISELEVGEQVIYCGEVYTVTAPPYQAKTMVGKEWNVEVEGGTENYLYASFFEDGMVDAVVNPTDEVDTEHCPICGGLLKITGDEDNGYGELHQYWKCTKCGKTGTNIYDMEDGNNFLSQEVD